MAWTWSFDVPLDFFLCTAHCGLSASLPLLTGHLFTLGLPYMSFPRKWAISHSRSRR